MQTDRPVVRDANGLEQELRIIGIEVRVRDYMLGGQIEELALLPADIRLPARCQPYGQRSLNITVHTNRGDVNFPMDSYHLPS